MSLISFSRDKFIPSDEVSLTVRGNYLSVTRGYQVFTFFKTANNGIPVFLDDHIDRIVGNAQSMKMNLSYSNQYGISLGLYEFERIDAEVKTPYTYYGGMKAHRALVHEGPFDEVLYTSKDEILEGTTFSFFIVNNGSVITSKLDGRILGSITRKNLLRIMDIQRIEHSESVISIDDLKNSSEAFIASANRDLIPVVSINNNQIGNGKIGPVYKKLMSLYQQEISKISI